MLKQLIVCLAICGLMVRGQISITLSPQQVKDAKGVVQDTIFTYKTVDNQQLIFDSRATQNYKLVSGVCVAGTFPLLSTVCTADAVQDEQVVTINGQVSGKLRWSKVAANSGSASLVNLGVGLQIPASQLEPYFQNRLSKTFRTQTQSFSFLFNPTINKIFFGQVQSYLSNNLVSFPVLWGTSTNLWTLTVSSFTKVGGNAAFKAANVMQAIFDTTTSKLLVPATVLAEVLSSVENLGSIANAEKCTLVKQTNTKLAFVFSGNDNKNNNFQVSLNDLIQTQADGTCTLLLQATTPAYNNQWVLGTSFLKNVYTYFNYDDHTISLGNINSRLTIDPVTPSNSWSTAFIIVGILLTLLSLFALVTLIQPINYVQPQLTQTKPKTQNQQPQTQSVVLQQQYYQPQYVQSVQPQRFIVYQQPAVNSTISSSALRQSSPTRIVQQQGPQQVIRQ